MNGQLSIKKQITIPKRKVMLSPHNLNLKYKPKIPNKNIKQEVPAHMWTCCYVSIRLVILSRYSKNYAQTWVEQQTNHKDIFLSKTLIENVVTMRLKRFISGILKMITLKEYWINGVGSKINHSNPHSST